MPFDPKEFLEDDALDEMVKSVPYVASRLQSKKGTTAPEAFAKNLAQGATLEFGDELSPLAEKGIAGVHAIGSKLLGREVPEVAKRTLETPVSELRQEYRKDIAQTRREHPGYSLGGGFVGSLLPTLAAAPLAVAAPITTAAAAGGIQAAGAAEGDLGHIAEEAAKGALIGGAFGAATKLASKTPQVLGNMANNLASKALGFIKATIKRAGGTEKVLGASGELLKQGVIGRTLAKTAENIEGLRQATGKVIGDVIKSLDEKGFTAFDPKELMQKISNATIDPSTGMTIKEMINLPVFRPLKNAFNSILATIDDPKFASGSYEAAQKLKSIFGSLAFKEGRELPGKEIAAKAYRVVRDVIDGAIEKAGTLIDDKQLASKFFDAKKAYQAAKTAEIGIEDALQRATGNRNIGLTDFLVLTGSLGQNPQGNIALTLGKKALESGAVKGFAAKAAQAGSRLTQPLARLPGLAGTIGAAGESLRR